MGHPDSCDTESTPPTVYAFQGCDTYEARYHSSSSLGGASVDDGKHAHNRNQLLSPTVEEGQGFYQSDDQYRCGSKIRGRRPVFNICWHTGVKLSPGDKLGPQGGTLSPRGIVHPFIHPHNTL
jgi:hypothetical protein